MRERSYFFHEGDLSATLDAHGRKVREKIDSIEPDQLLATPVEDLVEHIVSQMYVEPLQIYEEQMTRDQLETKIDVAGWPGRFTRGDGPCLVPAIRVTVSLPFTGDVNLWRLRPNTWCSVVPHGTVTGDTVDMVFERPLDEPLEPIKKNLEENLELIRKHIAWQKESIDQFNNGLANTVRSAVEARRQRLAKHDKLAEILKIPLRRNAAAPAFKPIQVQRRIVKPLPPPPSGGFKPEWEIAEEEYENILTIIRHEGRTFEATPRTYAAHDEEELRDIMLAHLNGHYKGEASGETFRRSGKTDIKIEAENRAAFVAECKVWKGPKTIADSIDQLLGYLTWRDCKTAIVIFNKYVAGFMDILQKTKSTLESHPRFMRIAKATDEGEWRCVFRSKDDDARLVHVQVFVFNLYVPPKKEDNDTTTRSRGQ